MNKRLKAIMLSNSLFILGGSILTPVYAVYSESIGAGIQLAGVLFAIKFIANAVADVVVISIREQLSFTEHIYKSSMFVRGLAWIYLGMFPSVQSLFIVQVVTGLAEGFGTPSFSALMSDNLDKNKHVKEWAIWDLIKNPLMAVAGALSGVIVTYFGFSVMFYIMGCLAIVGSLVPITKPVKRKKRSKNHQ